MSQHLFSSLRVLRKSPATEGSDLTHKIQRTRWRKRFFFSCKGFPSSKLSNKELLLNPFQLLLVWSHTAQALSEHCSSTFSLQNTIPRVFHSHQALLDGTKLTKHQLWVNTIIPLSILSFIYLQWLYNLSALTFLCFQVPLLLLPSPPPARHSTTSQCSHIPQDMDSTESIPPPLKCQGFISLHHKSLNQTLHFSKLHSGSRFTWSYILRAPVPCSTSAVVSWGKPFTKSYFPLAQVAP